MDESRSVIEFEASLDTQGKIAVPRAAIQHLGKVKGPLRVRLTRLTISSDLKKKGVSEEEIEHISALQLESHEQVFKFLLSQGSLRKHKRFRARIATYKKGLAN